jgi:predicted dehydrogenase
VSEPLQLGLVGYGAGGRLFHSPFIAAAEGITLSGIVTRSPDRVAEARNDWPDVPVFSTLEAMLESGVDAVTITTPPITHVDLAATAIAHGVHAVVDKPFAPSVAEARQLIDLAEAGGVLLSVYQNRRWDSDLVTLAQVVESGELGNLWRVHSRMDQDNYASVHPGRGNGLLLDLGTHLIDQMVCLLGPVATVDAHLYWVDMPGGRAEAAFTLAMQHANGVLSTLESTKAHRLAVRELRALGTSGAYAARCTDVQERDIKAGRRPGVTDAAWGFEPEEAWGVLTTKDGERRVPSSQGRWQDFYSRFAAATRGQGPQPVPAAEALHVLQIIEAAKASAAAGSTVRISEAG